MEILEYYTDIIHRYLCGTAEKNELIELLEWLKAGPENVIFFNQVCILWGQSHGSVSDKQDTEVALIRLTKRIEGLEPVGKEKEIFANKSWIPWFRNIAAVLIVLVACGLLIKYYVIDSSKKPSNPEYVYAYAPPSQKSQIILSDGTVVWLNSGTRMKYPTNYGEKTRDVYLEGEAFFKVAKNPKKPFLVHASSITVKAIGTSFDVKCYASDKTIETILVEGRVQIGKEASGDKTSGSVFLNPNEKAVFNKNNQEIQIAKFEKPKSRVKEEKKQQIPVIYEEKTLQSEISWKEQRLVFENEAFEDLSKRLERWYNVNIRIKDSSLLKNRYTGKFVNNEPLEQVLLVIGKTTPISYTIDKDNITIDSKK
ncbi:MAG TPA: FecR family protein [Bacteroidales bacterium]